MIEPSLGEVVLWADDNGEERQGATLEEIGGNFNPSEGFDIVLKTDGEGELEDVVLRFDNSSRMKGSVRLNLDKVRECADFYKALHQEK